LRRFRIGLPLQYLLFSGRLSAFSKYRKAKAQNVSP